MPNVLPSLKVSQAYPSPEIVGFTSLTPAGFWDAGFWDTGFWDASVTGFSPQNILSATVKPTLEA